MVDVWAGEGETEFDTSTVRNLTRKKRRTGSQEDRKTEKKKRSCKWVHNKTFYVWKMLPIFHWEKYGGKWKFDESEREQLERNNSRIQDEQHWKSKSLSTTWYSGPGWGQKVVKMLAIVSLLYSHFLINLEYVTRGSQINQGFLLLCWLHLFGLLKSAN